MSIGHDRFGDNVGKAVVCPVTLMSSRVFKFLLLRVWYALDVFPNLSRVAFDSLAILALIFPLTHPKISSHCIYNLVGCLEMLEHTASDHIHGVE